MPTQGRAPTTRKPSAASAKLARELGKSAGFDSLEQEVFLNLIRAHEAITEPFAKLFRSRGVSMPLYNILRILRGNGAVDGSGKGLAIQKIGEQMLTREPDMTRLIDRLEKAGHAVRKRCPEDRRVVHVEVTRSGLDLLDELDEPVRALDHDSLAHLSERELETLSALLAKARPPSDDD